MPGGGPEGARARVEELRSRFSGPQAAQIRNDKRAEEAARLAATPLAARALDDARREKAAEAFAGLFDYFAIASASESRYHDDNSQVQALDEAIEAVGAARADPRHGDLAPDRRAISALVAARVLGGRYEIAGNTEDLDSALALADEATDFARRAVPDLLAETLVLLGEQLMAEFDRDARHEHVDRAVQVLREAFRLGGPPRAGGARRAAVAFAGALLLRAKALGGRADLDDAAGLLQRTLADHPDVRVLDALGCVLITRAEQTGFPGDLDAAVDALERAVRMAPDEPWFKANLAVALRQRFTANGERGDERRAAELLERALSDIPAGAPDRLRILHNVDPAFSESAPAADQIARARALVEATSPGARARPARQAALALGLMNAFGETLDPALLAEALAVCEDGLRTADRGSVDRPNLLAQKARALLLSYARGSGDDLLGQAIATADEALNSAAEASPERAAFALTLAQAWTLRGSVSGAPGDLDRASAAFRLATGLGQRRDPGTALAAGRQWGAWAAEEARWQEAAEAFDGALDAAEELYRRQVGRHGREAWLKLAPGLPADAAVAAARAGQPDRAVLALERGRARMLSDALDRDRAQVSDLREAGRAELAERFTLAAAELAAQERSQDRTGEQDDVAVAAAKAAFDAVVEEIRGLPGHELFLARATFADVASAARTARCPIVYLASGSEGVVAAVRADGQAVVQVLPELDEASTLRRVASFVTASQQRRRDPGGWQTELTRVTDWLGQVIWPTVLETAGACDRVVLIPSGLLGLLPMHAAARPDPTAATGRRYALDDVLVSYAPNARALKASSALAAQVACSSVLTVGAADHAGEEPLRYGDREAEVVRAAFATGRYIPAAEAAKQEVLDALAHFDVLHFACHGRTDLFDPLAGALLLADHDALTVRDILGLRLPGTRLAILSACESAVIGAALPDEVISLPAGLLQAGCAAVIGSLWQVPDASTLLLMSYFVREWQQQHAEPAQALRRAQQRVRDLTNRDLAAVGAPGLDSPPANPRLTEAWAARRPYAHPQAWAAFAFVGA